MKKNKIFLGIFIAFVIVALSIIAIILWVLPKNLGPIEPFLNFNDVFTQGWFGEVFTQAGGEMPNKPAYYQISPDCSTGDLAQSSELIQPEFGCDSWQLNRYERPFNALSQDIYYPDLDIQNALFGRDAEWYYLRIALYDPQPGIDYLAGTYALEMDLDDDGRGDLLVLVSEPGKQDGKEWSTQGVQIWADSNNDVGGEKPRIPDKIEAADSYDTLLFNQGIGDDAGGAWARAFLTGSAYVELAFKTDYLKGDIAFKWWVWSGSKSSTLALYDLHDYYSQEQAGAAYQGMNFFPVKHLFALDSSCANMWGASPDPKDPDYCQYEVKIPDYRYNTCLMLKCAIPLIPCRIPPDKPGDDPCVLNFEEWLYSIWKKDHPNESLPPEGMLWLEYAEYLKNPECPEDGVITPTPTPTSTATPTSTPTPTYTPTPTPTPTDTPTPRPSPTPTFTPTPRQGCDYDCGCEPAQGETKENCPSDCPQHCGNGMCDCGEDERTCPEDCITPTPVCSVDLTKKACQAAGGTYIESSIRASYCQCP